MAPPKLFMLLLGCKPPGRHVEQHDIFFGIGESLKQLVPQINSYWPDAGKIHIDAWREVSCVNEFQIQVVPRNIVHAEAASEKLFFINLGGYQENRFEEQHYVMLSVNERRESAIQASMDTVFFRHNHFPGANSHIDDKYGIDVDDIYEIDEMLNDDLKNQYQLKITKHLGLPEDVIHLGYFKLNALPDE